MKIQLELKYVLILEAIRPELKCNVEFEKEELKHIDSKIEDAISRLINFSVQHMQ